MEVSIRNISKRYSSQWIISDFTLELPSGSITGVKGINGSGKSTMLKMISGFLSPSEGTIEYFLSGKKVDRADVYNYVSLAGPYTSVVQEYNLQELIQFHLGFKSFRDGLSPEDVVDIIQLNVRDKRLEEFSSGMLQKVQLALAILSDSRLLLLDEPTSFLDEENKKWFTQVLGSHLKDRTIVIASNADADFEFCEKVITL